jgi:hypothetical protein
MLLAFASIVATGTAITGAEGYVGERCLRDLLRQRKRFKRILTVRRFPRASCRSPPHLLPGATEIVVVAPEPDSISSC